MSKLSGLRLHLFFTIAVLISAASVSYAEEPHVSQCALTIEPSADALSLQLTSALQSASNGLKNSGSYGRAQAHRELSKFTREVERLRYAEAQTLENEAQRSKMRNVERTLLERIKNKLEAREEEEIATFEFKRQFNDHEHAVHWTVTVVYENDIRHELGEIVYSVRGHRLDIISFDIFVEPRFRGLGVSAVLAAKAIEDNPQTTRIDSALVAENRDAYVDAIYRDGLPPDQAVQKTPAYRIRHALGYEIDLRESTLPVHPNRQSLIRLNAVRADVPESPGTP